MLRALIKSLEHKHLNPLFEFNWRKNENFSLSCNHSGLYGIFSRFNKHYCAVLLIEKKWGYVLSQN